MDGDDYYGSNIQAPELPTLTPWLLLELPPATTPAMASTTYIAMTSARLDKLRAEAVDEAVSTFNEWAAANVVIVLAESRALAESQSPPTQARANERCVVVSTTPDTTSAGPSSAVELPPGVNTTSAWGTTVITFGKLLKGKTYKDAYAQISTADTAYLKWVKDHQNNSPGIKDFVNYIRAIEIIENITIPNSSKVRQFKP